MSAPGPPPSGPPEPVDVALLLEGTYPFVPGGVSSWVHGIIAGMPDLSFGLIFIGANYEPDRKMKFSLPDNVRWVLEWGVYDFLPDRPPAPGAHGAGAGKAEALAAVTQLCFDLHEGRMAGFDRAYEALRRRELSMGDLAYGPDAWRLLKTVYEARGREISFLDFFWTWRFAYLPVLNLFFCDLPKARVYHAICTGWAGLLGAIAKKKHGAPLILTEHGIYLNERRIEICQSEWIYTQEEDNLTIRRELGFFKELWIHLFEAVSRLCYERCDAIYTLYGGNKKMQAEFGAPEERIEIIPNGVDIEALTPKTPINEGPGAENRSFRVGFVGRIVPIKDIKTLIRACRLVVNELPEAEILLMGPTEEDPAYFKECRDLATLLGLGEKLKFMGRVNVREYFPTLDVQVLTSISEGQPLVMLEGYCSGVPVVATNVGACREMIEGMGGEDRDLGPSGIVTGVGNPDETGRAILRILREPGLQRAMAEAARRRVRKCYDYRQMIARYRGVYEAHGAGGARDGAAAGASGGRNLGGDRV